MPMELTYDQAQQITTAMATIQAEGPKTPTVFTVMPRSLASLKAIDVPVGNSVEIQADSTLGKQLAPLFTLDTSAQKAQAQAVLDGLGVTLKPPVEIPPGDVTIG